MSTGEIPDFDARVALCEKLIPRIARATIEFFDPYQQHPYLEGLANGGLITSHPDRDTEDTEYLTIAKASGLRDTFTPEKFAEIGIPAEVALNGLMWVVRKTESEFEKDVSKHPGQKKWNGTDHVFTYWNGSEWHAARLKKEYDQNGPWEDKWESSELTTEEANTIRNVVAQTQDIHTIANEFEGDHYAFEKAILAIPRDEHLRAILSRGLVPPPNTPIYGATPPYDSLPAYMRYHTTGYQNGNLIKTAHALATHNSFRLDSGGISASMYHLSSTRPTSEMFEKGLNIPLQNIHPPVPEDFTEV